MKLRELRKKNNLSMKELGEIFGLSESTISLYENNKREPDIATLTNMAQYFNVSVDELLGIQSNKNNYILTKNERETVRDSHSPVMINFEKMCSTLDETTLDRIHTILYSLRRIQDNANINIEDKKYLFACIAEIVGRIELYTDNFQSVDNNSKNIDFSSHNKRFINGEVEVIKEIANTINPETKPSKERKIVIPFYETPASAGTGSSLYDDIPAEWITVAKNEITVDADFIIEVRGDSMRPKFFDGDRVLVKQSSRIFEGEIGVFILNSESYIKKMGRGELISLNPAYEPIKLTEFDDARCAGKVLGTIEL